VSEWESWPYVGGTETYRRDNRRWVLWLDDDSTKVPVLRLGRDPFRPSGPVWRVDVQGTPQFELDGGDLEDDAAKAAAVRESLDRLRRLVDLLELA
jgi:hypothetical protein